MSNNFWNEKNVFVTGADGFIGGWLTKYLVNNGANVFVIIRDIKKKCSLDLLGIKEKVHIIIGDILDRELVERVMNEKQINVCFHLAAQAIVGIANSSPISTFETNIKGTWNILEACRLHKVDRIIVASSDKAYGVHRELPYTEEAPLNGVYPYDASKVCVDVLARSYAKSFGMKVAVTRNANTYGGADLHFDRIIPGALKSIFTNQELIIRSDGTPERDYMYVKDAAEAYLLLAENLYHPEVIGGAFNFGTGEPVSVLDVFKRIVNITGKNTTINILGKAKNEIDRQYLCIDKVKKLLNWKPKYSLNDGLKETIDWYQEYFKNNPN